MSGENRETDRDHRPLYPACYQHLRLEPCAVCAAESLRASLEDPVCDCSPSDLDIGGRGHLSDCWTAEARATLRRLEVA